MSEQKLKFANRAAKLAAATPILTFLVNPLVDSALIYAEVHPPFIPGVIIKGAAYFIICAVGIALGSFVLSTARRYCRESSCHQAHWEILRSHTPWVIAINGLLLLVTVGIYIVTYLRLS